MIVATDLENGIGLNNDIPWNFSKDMKFFKEKTIGNKNNAIVMGYNTYMSIGKPLLDRVNIVLSRKKAIIGSLYEKGIIVLSNPDDILTMKQFDEIWIIGGGQIYDYFLSKSYLLNEIYITKINKKYNCNTFFPKLSDNFVVTNTISVSDDDKKTNEKIQLELLVYKSK